MKKLILILALVMAGRQLSAQSVIDRFFQKYEDDRSFTLVSVTPKMFSMFSKLDINTGEGQQFMSVVKKLKGLRILAKEDAKDGSKLYREAAAFLTRDFEELMTVRDGQSDLKFLVKENARGNIAELIMLVGSTNEFVAMSLVGDIDLNEIAQIASGMNIQGMDNLKKLKK
ncbi:DUF4252 domain-containing protein [Chitinophaga japonensis]|uniref:Uncharacterized protein DUF4252 n=1 Tax=Chitinophaga japonensis TaxID=104662 RepID=A0A562SM79_CHIJA|nr:DUF4252 domain-containing protein [Chitinophaga japonensis]TWI82382.1 uncharacterized protein DUF4252 [Chitinophaga japonensis]